MRFYLLNDESSFAWLCQFFCQKVYFLIQTFVTQESSLFCMSPKVRPKRKKFDWHNPTDPIYPADLIYIYFFNFLFLWRKWLSNFQKKKILLICLARIRFIREMEKLCYKTDNQVKGHQAKIESSCHFVETVQWEG